MLKWLKQLKSCYEASFLWIISLIYFTQGFTSFGLIVVQYHLKDTLKLSASASQFVSTVALIPWTINPLFRILSDYIPIRGKRRKPYLVISSVLSLVPWINLGLNSSLRTSIVPLLILLIVQNVGSSMTGAVADAMLTEAFTFDDSTIFGDLQSISLKSMALGGIIGSLLGGYALNNQHINAIFVTFAILPGLTFVSCGLIEESPINTEDLIEDLSLVSPYMRYGDDYAYNFSNGFFKTSKSKRKKKKKKKSPKNRKRAFTSNNNFESKAKNRSLALQWYSSLKLVSYTLFNAFRRPIILRPMTWFFLAHVTFPDLSTVMLYYETEFLKLDASFLGNSRIVGWLALILGTSIYTRYLKTKTLRKTLLLNQIGSSIIILIHMVLVSRANIAYGISDKLLILFRVAADAINQFKFIPFPTLYGQLYPPGIEKILCGLFMSINILGGPMSSFVGAWLASILNISSSSSFENLFLCLVIQFLCSFIPLAFLFLIPKDATCEELREKPT